MTITRIKGELEINHERGVIYFHGDKAVAAQYGVITALRISRIPTPIPLINNRMLDLSGPHCNWKGVLAGFEGHAGIDEGGAE